MLVLFFALVHAPCLPAEDRALAYLIREVPAWNAAHKCFSCHNNGDGARTLYTAIRLGRAVPDKALADTARWLEKPEDWVYDADDKSHSDMRLDRIQFGTALLEAMDAGRIKERKPLLKAAELIAAQQQRDGYWPVGADGSVGSPATHGATLATVNARRILERADRSKYKEAIRKADDWLDRKTVKSVLDAAGVLLYLEKADGAEAAARRKECCAVLRIGEAEEGGWGPYVNSSPEVFDTALVVLALSRQPESEEMQTWVKRGRAYLVRLQQKDGSWQETTRPSGAESYAQRISTTAWAAQALLATR
jgi:squalene cyclase